MKENPFEDLSKKISQDDAEWRRKADNDTQLIWNHKKHIYDKYNQIVMQCLEQLGIAMNWTNIKYYFSDNFDEAMKKGQTLSVTYGTPIFAPEWNYNFTYNGTWYLVKVVSPLDYHFMEKKQTNSEITFEVTFRRLNSSYDPLITEKGKNLSENELIHLLKIGTEKFCKTYPELKVS